MFTCLRVISLRRNAIAADGKFSDRRSQRQNPGNVFLIKRRSPTAQLPPHHLDFHARSKYDLCRLRIHPDVKFSRRRYVPFATWCPAHYDAPSNRLDNPWLSRYSERQIRQRSQCKYFDAGIRKGALNERIYCVP